MPAERQPAQKRRRLPFNPPRPRASASAGPSSAAPKSKTKSNTRASTGSTSRGAKKSAPSRQRVASPSASRSASPASAPGSRSGSGSGSGTASPVRERSISQEPDFILAEITTTGRGEDVDSSEPAIPPKLLTRLLHHHFQNEKTKIAKDANVAVAKYVDIFVREALARAAYERAEGEGTGGGRTVRDGFLEVEDLEKMAPQLVLDF